MPAKQKLPDEQTIARLTAAAVSYHGALMAGPSPAGEYLRGRGLTPEDVFRFRIGWVKEPIDEHRSFQDWIAIPYLTPSGEVQGIKFRRIDLGTPKYLWETEGCGPTLYNAMSLLGPGPAIICEGELDAVVAARLPVAAVAVPGVEMWTAKPWFPRLFEGHRRVIIAVDGDPAGIKMGETIRKQLDYARVVEFPHGQDVSSYAQVHGMMELARLLGVEAPRSEQE